MDKEYYSGIDGLRTVATIGIVMMHIRVNNKYAIPGYIYNNVIPSFTNFVFLFMVLSAFSMCCGYYIEVLNNQLSISDFYKRRIKRIWPFFAVLVSIDLIVSQSIDAVYEGFADLTLMFGLLPDAGNMAVIGVGWFLGLIFVFYLCFPFFCFLLENRKRAWIAFAVSLILNFLCIRYFKVGRTNILYSSCFFMAGGLVYLYRVKISQLNRGGVLLVSGIAVLVHYLIGGNTATWLFVSVTLLILQMCPQGREKNRLLIKFSRISMEVYLCHMFIFRIIEKLRFNTIIGDGWFQYLATVILVLVGSVLFAIFMQHLLKIGDKVITKRRKGLTERESTFSQ